MSVVDVARKVARAKVAELQAEGNGDAATTAEVETPKREIVNMTGWRNNPPPPVPLLIGSVIPRGCVVGNVGSPGLMKSAFAQTLGMSLATGKKLFPTFAPERIGKVLLLDFEDGKHERRRRTCRYAQGYEFTDHDWGQLEQNFYLCCLNSEAIIDHKGAPTELTMWLANEIRSKGIDLCIIDTFVHTGCPTDDEDNNQTNNARMNIFKRLTELRKEGTTIWLIHHVAKSRDGEHTTAAARGAGVFRDGCRALLTTTGLSPDDVKRYGVANPRRFACIDSPKTSWTAPLSAPVYFECFDGLWRETDMVQRMAETKQAMTENLLTVVAEVIEGNPHDISLSELLDPRREPARNIGKAIRDHFGRVTNQQIHDAVKHGLRTGYLEAKPNNKPGKKAIVPAYFRIPVNSRNEQPGFSNL